MNEGENTAVVNRTYDAFGKGDIQTILEHLSDDVEWIFEAPSVIPYSGRKKGRVQVREFFESVVSTQEDIKLTVETTISNGEEVVTRGRYQARVKTTGQQIDSPIAQFFTVRNGKITRHQIFGDTAATAAAYSAAAASA